MSESPCIFLRWWGLWCLLQSHNLRPTVFGTCLHWLVPSAPMLSALGWGSLTRRNKWSEGMMWLPTSCLQRKPINSRMAHIIHTCEIFLSCEVTPLFVDMCISVVYKYTCTHIHGVLHIFHKDTYAFSFIIDTCMDIYYHKYSLYSHS